MEKVIHKLINEFTEGVDTYTHNGSTWLIFTDTKQWVIELTEEKTLWYNYNFFKGMFAYTSMDVVENQHYITKWVEDNIINKVKDTILERNITEGEVEEIIENGVKETSSNVMMFQSMKVKDTIQNGVKHTITSENRSRLTAENIIENGVKLTNKSLQTDGSCVIEDTIQNGVRHTEIGWHQCNNIDDAIEKGVKEIYNYKGHRWDVKDVIQDGVRDISPMTQYTNWQVEEIIENGVKETQFNSYENKSWVEGVIKNGVRHTLNTEYMPTSMVEDIIQSGVKHTEYGDWLDGDERLDDIVKNGVKRSLPESFVDSSTIIDIIQNGVKETKTPGNGDIESTNEWMKENNSTSYPKMIDDIIENGIKKTILRQNITDGNVETIIETGIKETQPLPDQSGELIGYGNYYHGKEDRTKAFYNYLEETIKFGVKET
jgi:hypothetical protein